MGLDITVMIVDWSWLSESPPSERLPRLRDAWYDDETGFWDHDAPAIEEGWDRPRGPHGSRFAVYEFPDTSGSFKAHFWAGQRWEKVREHADASVRAELDTLLSGLIWYGPDGETDPADPDGFFGDGPGVYGMLLAQSPDAVRELASAWERTRPGLDGLRQAFTEHAAGPTGWVGTFEAFTDLLEGWGVVLTEAARRGWGVVGLSE